MRVYSPEEKINFFRENAVGSMLNWEQSPNGHHIELGISENSLFLLLNMLGLSQEFSGEVLLPVGTVYDPFIGRGLDALTYAAYTESKFIFAGTPSGITLSPEGGAHQSLITPSIGMEMPNLVYYEPTFAQELEWIFLAGLRNLLDRKRGRILYLRLSTRPVPQNLSGQGSKKSSTVGPPASGRLKGGVSAPGAWVRSALLSRRKRLERLHLRSDGRRRPGGQPKAPRGRHFCQRDFGHQSGPALPWLAASQ
jgi:pyruvate dehydrogenase complex dehydrogenase (E1) component